MCEEPASVSIRNTFLHFSSASGSEASDDEGSSQQQPSVLRAQTFPICSVRRHEEAQNLEGEGEGEVEVRRSDQRPATVALQSLSSGHIGTESAADDNADADADDENDVDDIEEDFGDFASSMKRRPGGCPTRLESLETEDGIDASAGIEDPDAQPGVERTVTMDPFEAPYHGQSSATSWRSMPSLAASTEHSTPDAVASATAMTTLWEQEQEQEHCCTSDPEAGRSRAGSAPEELEVSRASSVQNACPCTADVSVRDSSSFGTLPNCPMPPSPSQCSDSSDMKRQHSQQSQQLYTSPQQQQQQQQCQVQQHLSHESASCYCPGQVSMYIPVWVPQFATVWPQQQQNQQPMAMSPESTAEQTHWHAAVAAAASSSHTTIAPTATANTASTVVAAATAVGSALATSPCPCPGSGSGSGAYEPQHHHAFFSLPGGICGLAPEQQPPHLQQQQQQQLQHEQRPSAPLETPQSPQQPAAARRQVPPEERTTVMLRNLPKRVDRSKLVELMEREGFENCYDFVYVPFDFRRREPQGYAFVNLTTPAHAQRFFEHFDGFDRFPEPTGRICSTGWSDPHQGREANVQRYRNSPLMHKLVPDSYRPAIYDEGRRVPFPPPTRKIKEPRQGTERMLV